MRRRRAFPRLGLLAIALLVALAATGVTYAAWMDEVQLKHVMTTAIWDLGGTTDIWTDWRHHYDEAEVEGWLAHVDAASEWLGPTSVQGLDNLFAAATKGCPTMKDRFLAHYMATRLNIASGRLGTGNTHDITGIVGHIYLGLSEPEAATLSAIVTAIEAKYPQDPDDEDAVWPDSQEYGTMRSICIAVNNLET